VVERVACSDVDDLLRLDGGLHELVVGDEGLLVLGVIGEELLLDSLGEHVFAAGTGFERGMGRGAVGTSAVGSTWRWGRRAHLTVVMMFFACSSLVITQRVAWLSASGVDSAERSLIWTIALRTVAASSLRDSTRAGSSKMPHGTWQ
jgi:hypothetical protein